jgi:hypothetical protein
MRSGDKILEVDGWETTGHTSDEIIARLKGKPDTKVTLKYVRPGSRSQAARPGPRRDPGPFRQRGPAARQDRLCRVHHVRRQQRRGDQEGRRPADRARCAGARPRPAQQHRRLPARRP